MKVSVNSRVKKFLDIFSGLPEEKRDALEKMIDAYVKESEEANEEPKTDKISD